jgi:TolA-binding protein
MLVALLLPAAPRRTEACGPSFLRAVFIFKSHPDVPLERFARGEIGVLQPTYARSYLVAAYRHLSGTGFNAREQQALVNFWRERASLDWVDEDEKGSGVQAWLQARSQVLIGEPAPKISVYRTREKPNEWDYYLNCQPDAFANATATLNARVNKYGAASPFVKDWVRAQDEVFANCEEGRRVPARLDASADPLLRADRAYQIAAALFYSTQFDEARQAFEEISREQSSPWRQKAHYLVARTLLRKASLGAEAERQGNLTQAEAQLEKILKDKSLEELHAASRKLLTLVKLRGRPEDRLRELSSELLRKNSETSVRQDLWDYTHLLDRYEVEETVGDYRVERRLKDVPESVRQDDMTDWIVAFQSKEPTATEHALKKWEQTSSDAWLVAALSKVDGTHPQAASLQAAAAKVAPQSAAFPGALHGSVRLMLEAGRADEAREVLDRHLSQGVAAFPPSASNALLELRLKLARDADEFFKYAQRVPSALTWDDDGNQMPADEKELAAELRGYTSRRMFDVDAVRIINEALPLSMLVEAAGNQAIPAHLRRDLAVAAWVRSVLLDDRAAGREIAPVLASLAPELKSLLEDERAGATADARRFSAVYAILKSPGTQPFVDAGLARQTPLKEIDNYRDNWWCQFEEETRRSSSTGSTGADTSAQAKAASMSSPAFLNEAQRTAAARERARLSALETAPNYLARLAVEWANKSPSDPRVPEALHLVVKATRYGCSDEQTGELSKAAFQTLHRKYPNSPWAKKTPYWFKNS